MTVFPGSAPRSAPAGIVTFAPAATTRPSRTTMVALSRGTRAVPSISRTPVNALVAEEGWPARVTVSAEAIAAQGSRVRRCMGESVTQKRPLCGGRRHAGRRRGHDAEQPAQLLALHDLDVEQPARDGLELPAILAEDATRRVVRVGKDALDLGVDFLRRLLAVEPALLRHRDVEEPGPLLGVEVDRAERLARAELGDHRAGDVGGALQVVLRAGRNLAERDLFRRPPAGQHRELAEQIAARHEIAILEGQLHRVAERAETA